MPHPETPVKIVDLHEIRSELIRMRLAVTRNVRMRKEEKIYLCSRLNTLQGIIAPYLQTSMFNVI